MTVATAFDACWRCVASDSVREIVSAYEGLIFAPVSLTAAGKNGRMERLHSLLRPIVVKVAMKLNFRFSLRGPDRVSDALATVLSSKGAWEFKTLFDLVHANLRAKDFARGGDEMLRLRTHEKLQNFLSAGIVTKNGKEYKGVPKALAAFVKTSAEFNARFASGTHTYPAHKVSGAGAVATVMAEAAKTKPAAKKVKTATKVKAQAVKA